MSASFREATETKKQLHSMNRVRRCRFTRQIYTHVMRKPGIGVRSPLDQPGAPSGR
ncbi:MAG: hypothetical protein Q8J74_12490 [Candidatus Didemnitutus sp.]|nr:hypothetical protein [Candidatus Didemnitutus sp.]